MASFSSSSSSTLSRSSSKQTCVAARCTTMSKDGMKMVSVPKDLKLRTQILKKLGRTDQYIEIMKDSRLVFCMSHIDEDLYKSEGTIQFKDLDPIFFSSPHVFEKKKESESKRRHVLTKLEDALARREEAELEIAAKESLEDKVKRLELEVLKLSNTVGTLRESNNRYRTNHKNFVRAYDNEPEVAIQSAFNEITLLKKQLATGPLSPDLLLQRSSGTQLERDKLVRAVTGVGSQEDLVLLFDVCEAYNFEKHYDSGIKGHNLDWKTAIVFALCYLRLADPLEIMCKVHFPALKDVSVASRTFNRVILLLNDILPKFNKERAKDGVFRHRVFEDEKAFPQLFEVTEMADTFSIPIQKIRDNPNIRKSCNSMYYKAEVFKALVFCDRSLLISSVSKVYAGAITDPQIMDESGYWERAKEKDTMVVDKGFKCFTKALEKKITWLTPAYKADGRLTKEQIEHSKRISHVRKEIERLIERARRFRVLQLKLRPSQFRIVDRIISVIFHVSSLFGTELLLADPEEVEENSGPESSSTHLGEATYQYSSSEEEQDEGSSEGEVEEEEEEEEEEE